MSRIAIIGGSRTPFVKAGTVFKDQSALTLGIANVEATLADIGIEPEQLDELIYGTVLLDPRVPNLAREIVLRSETLPKDLPAHFVSNNCITGLIAAAFMMDGIKAGRIKTGLAGGVESMSQPALALSPAANRFFLGLNQQRSVSQKLKYLKNFNPKFLLPIPPSPKEPSTGLTMGQHCELTAKEFEISREAQDKLALASHQNAAQAAKRGYLADEIAAYKGSTFDNLVRPDTTLEKLSSLRTVFDRSEHGTLTAGNSSSLTDGAACVALADANYAAGQPRVEVIAYLEDICFAGIKPEDGLLMAPAFALTKLLQRNNLTIEQVDRFEIHEAFAAQVLSNLQVWEQGWSKYPDLKPIGRIPLEKINVNGSSMAIGHPFAATGGRLILSLAQELRRNNLSTGVISICAAGAMAGAALIRV